MRVSTYPDESNPFRVVFEGQPEIEIVRAAFAEHIYELEMCGNPSSVGDFDRAIAGFTYAKSQLPMRLREHGQVTDKLYLLHDNTDRAVNEMAELVAEVADDEQMTIRLQGVKWRYNLGNRALALAERVELKINEHDCDYEADVNMDAEFAPILKPKDS